MTNKPWQTEKGRQPLTAVWRNGGCSAKLNIRNSNKHLC
jgi:hypothetical protein